MGQCISVAWMLCSLIAGDGSYAPPEPKLAIDSIKLDWQDVARNRDVPVKIYFPKSLDKPTPVILFSHGLGGSREGYSYLGEYWAGNGYVVVHLQHIGSDDGVWRGQTHPPDAMRKAAMDPRNALDRAADVSFAIDRLLEMNKSDQRFKGKLDLDHIGLAGHSFGAHTTLAIAGQLPGIGQSMADPRVKAIIPISAPAPLLRRDLDRTYGSITIPALHITGTLDQSPIGDTNPEERRIPFDHMTHSEEYLIIFDGADHMVFAGTAGRPRAMLRNAEHDQKVQELTLQATTAFWDAYLRDGASARQWLSDGGLRELLADSARLETKRPMN